MERVLVAVEHDEFGGRELVQLAAEFGTDRPAGTGHQNPTTR